MAENELQQNDRAMLNRIFGAKPMNGMSSEDLLAKFYLFDATVELRKGGLRLLGISSALTIFPL